MSVTRAAGMPAYNAGSASGFVPEIWSGKLVEKLYTATCFGEIANTDYEGEISSQGDKVIIRTTPNITINDYEVGMTLNYQKPTSQKVELVVDQGKYFAFEVKDVDRMQSDIKLMDDWSNDAGQQMAIAVDRNVLAYAYTDVAAENAGATAGKISQGYNMGAVGAPVGLAKENVVDFIVDSGSVLFEQDVPMEGRWMVIPTWMAGLIKKSELKDASLSGDGKSMLRNGRIGMIDNYTLYVSNNVAHVTDGSAKVANLIFGHKKALTFASQITELEDLKNPNDFGKLVRGLNVFGRKVIDPNAIGHGYVYKA